MTEISDKLLQRSQQLDFIVDRLKHLTKAELQSVAIDWFKLLQMQNNKLLMQDKLIAELATKIEEQSSEISKLNNICIMLSKGNIMAMATGANSTGQA